MIRARDIVKSYADGAGPPVRVLDGLSLEVAEGDVVAVVGASGSGKSTLLHLLGGLDADYTGDIEVDGVRLTGLSDAALAAFRNRNVGFVFQSFHLVTGLSVKDNVLLPSFFGAPVPDAEARALAALERVGLGGKAHRTPARLSGGERQRVAIARALFPRPRVLLCDEPTGNLDARTGAGIVELFSELNAAGQTIIVVTHEERLSRAARRVLRMDAGRLAPEGGGA